MAPGNTNGPVGELEWAKPTHFDGPERSLRWHARRGVLAATAGERTVLLVLATSRYYMLDPVASFLWSRLESGASRESLAAALVEQFPVSTNMERVRADVAHVLTSLVQYRAVEAVDEDAAAEDSGRAVRTADTSRGVDECRWPDRPPSVLMCFLAMVYVRVLLRRRGLKPLLRKTYRRRAAVPASLAPSGWLSTVAANVAKAAAIHPQQTQCLERSMCAVVVLRRAGLDARLRLGVRVHPFTAHAWAEVAGLPVSEDPEHLQPYWAFPELDLRDLEDV